MLYFDRIDVSEGNDVNKKSASEKCDICHNWYFLNFSFKFQQNDVILLIITVLLA